MSDRHVHRPHALGLDEACALRRRWQPMAEDRPALRSRRREAPGEAVMRLGRLGAHGTFRATAEAFEIACALGLVLKPLRRHVQQATEARLDAAIARAQPKGVA